MEQIDFNLCGKEITVHNIFIVSPKGTNFKIIDNNCNELWSGTDTEFKQCKYKDCEVSFMSVVGEPCKDGYIYIELQIKFC